MNGWQRLGVVVSTLIAIPAAYSAYESGISKYEYVEAYQLPASAAGNVGNDAVYYAALKANPSIRQCVQDSVRVQSYADGSGSVRCEMPWGSGLDQAIRAIAACFAVVFGIGAIVFWVYRGFKPIKR